jgi:hypothetical protein
MAQQKRFNDWCCFLGQEETEQDLVIAEYTFTSNQSRV